MPLAGLMATPASLAATPPPTVAATPQEKAVAVVEPTIVYLSYTLDYYLDTGQSGLGYVGPFSLNGSCTGSFVSSDGYISTAGHCVDVSPGSFMWNAAIRLAIQGEVDNGNITAADGEAVLAEALGFWKVEGKAAGSPGLLSVSAYHAYGVSGKSAGDGLPARIVEVKSFVDGDVALIKIEAKNSPVLLLGSDSDVSVGTNVLAVGYPAASDKVVDPTLSPTFKDGQINSKTTREGVRVPVYEISAAVSPGMSGGPTVMLDGNIDVIYRAGLDASYARSFKDAIAKFDEVLGLEPSHLWAQQFKQKATEKQSAAPPRAKATAAAARWGSSRWWWWSSSSWC